MNTQIILTPAQLTEAQMGKEVILNTGATLTACPLSWGEWQYRLGDGVVVYQVRNALPGLEAAMWTLNATYAEYMDSELEWEQQSVQAVPARERSRS